MKRILVPGILALVAAGAVVVLAGRNRPDPSPGGGDAGRAARQVTPQAFHDGFDGPLDPSRWLETAEADFQERSVQAVEGRLRLRCATRGTRDDTVKFFGVRTASRTLLRPGARVATHLDWNNQANGCYLSAGLVLSPHATSGNPLTTPDWIKIEYVGVPPGKNARLVAAVRVAGRDRQLFTEGWPQKNREGRPIGLQQLEVRFKDGEFEVWEQGLLQYASQDAGLPFDAVHLYLQMSSHSNYPARDVYFDNVTVGPP